MNDYIIHVFSKPACVQCDMTYRVLDTAGAYYESHDVTEDARSMEIVKELGYLQAPVVAVYDVNGSLEDHWSGFQPERIKQYL